MTPALPPLLCQHCGTCAEPLVGPRAGQHAARALCRGCGRWLKWLPRSLTENEKEKPPMGGIARCTVVGVIGRHEVEVRYSNAGAPCASLTVVVSEQGQDGKTHDLYVPCEVWGKRAEAASELEPGAWVLFEGKLAKRKKGDQWERLVAGFDLMSLWHPQASMTGSPN